jgi:hypothetical protein
MRAATVIKPQFLCHPAQSLVLTPTEQSRFLYGCLACRLFNYAVSNTDVIQLRIKFRVTQMDRIRGENGAMAYLEILSHHSPRDCDHEYPSHDSQYLGEDSNQTPSEYESTALHWSVPNGASGHKNVTQHYVGRFPHSETHSICTTFRTVAQFQSSITGCYFKGLLKLGLRSVTTVRIQPRIFNLKCEAVRIMTTNHWNQVSNRREYQTHLRQWIT